MICDAGASRGTQLRHRDALISLKKAVFNANVDIALLHSEWSIQSDGIGPCIATEVIRRQPDGSWRYVNDILDDPRP